MIYLQKGCKIYPRMKFFQRNLGFSDSSRVKESKNFEIIFESFQKMQDGSKFGKKLFLGIFIQNFFQIWAILNFL
jgi:hypothetical protein